MCASVSLKNESVVRRATVGEVGGSSSYGPDRPRRKSVSSACERCRRRKIRCDGDHPCATCARFSVACVRPNRNKDRMSLETQAALEERVRRLEAKLAETTAAQGKESSDDFYGDWPFDSDLRQKSEQPILKLETNFEPLRRSFSFDDNFGGSNSLTSPDIPMIEITGCETPGSIPLSPSPSGISTPDPNRASTPIGGSALHPPIYRQAPSPPISPAMMGMSGAVDDDGGYVVSPNSSFGDPISRRSSISSLGLDQDSNPFDASDLPAFQDSFFTTDVFGSDSLWDYQVPVQSLPLRTEAERLGNFFFEFTNREDIPIDRRKFQNCLTAVYSLPNVTSPPTLNTAMILSATQFSIGIARFQVFMVMAIALKMTGKVASDGTTMETCYQYAMQQTRSPTFWEDHGGIEMAILLAVFAKARDLQ